MDRKKIWTRLYNKNILTFPSSLICYKIMCRKLVPERQITEMENSDLEKSDYYSLRLLHFLLAL